MSGILGSLEVRSVFVVFRLTVCVCSTLFRGWGDFFFQAEDGIRDLVRSRGLGDVYKRQLLHRGAQLAIAIDVESNLPRRQAAEDRE